MTDNQPTEIVPDLLDYQRQLAAEKPLPITQATLEWLAGLLRLSIYGFTPINYRPLPNGNYAMLIADASGQHYRVTSLYQVGAVIHHAQQVRAALAPITAHPGGHHS